MVVMIKLLWLDAVVRDGILETYTNNVLISYNYKAQKAMESTDDGESG